MSDDFQTLKVEQTDTLDFLVTIEDWELSYTGDERLCQIGEIGELERLLEAVKRRRRHDGRDLILETSEIGEWIANLPKRTKLIHTKAKRDYEASRYNMWRIGFRIRFLDPSYATLFKLRFC